MKTLLLLRHAKSSWKDVNLDDHDRPLNKRGKRDAPVMGQLLKDENLVPDYVICSTSKRTKATSKKSLTHAGYEGSVTFKKEIYHADPRVLLNVLQNVPNAVCRPLLIGHNPGLEELITILTGREEVFPTAALAEISFQGQNWTKLNPSLCRLENLWRPRELPTQY